MKKMFLFILVMVGTLAIFSQEVVNLRKLSVSKIPIKEDVIFKKIRGIETDNNDRLYLLNSSYGNILVIDIPTGKLVATISSRGQGPYELGEPNAFKIKQNKIYVIDGVYKGVKIFNTEGGFIRSFKVNQLSSYSRRIDVDDFGNIYVPCLNYQDKKTILILDEFGKTKKTIIYNSFMGNKYSEEMFKNLVFDFSVDHNSNLILVYPLHRKIIKYNNDGILIWENNIPVENIPRGWKKEISVSENGSVSLSPLIGKMCLNDEGEVIVSTIDRLIRFKENGEIKGNIFGLNMAYEISWGRDRFISADPSDYVLEIFKYKEEK